MERTAVVCDSSSFDNKSQILDELETAELVRHGSRLHGCRTAMEFEIGTLYDVLGQLTKKTKLADLGGSLHVWARVTRPGFASGGAAVLGRRRRRRLSRTARLARRLAVRRRLGSHGLRLLAEAGVARCHIVKSRRRRRHRGRGKASGHGGWSFWSTAGEKEEGGCDMLRIGFEFWGFEFC